MYMNGYNIWNAYTNITHFLNDIMNSLTPVFHNGLYHSLI